MVAYCTLFIMNACTAKHFVSKIWMSKIIDPQWLKFNIEKLFLTFMKIHSFFSRKYTFTQAVDWTKSKLYPKNGIPTTKQFADDINLSNFTEYFTQNAQGFLLSIIILLIISWLLYLENLNHAVSKLSVNEIKTSRGVVESCTVQWRNTTSWVTPSNF